jgi:XTP/dITP diphosphohydrolase
MEIVLATHNRGKRAEFLRLMSGARLRLLDAAELGLAEPAETATTFLGNARLKAEAAARATGLPALADDSGLSVEALGGAPGPLTADWAATPRGRDFALAMRRCHAALVAAGASPDVMNVRAGFVAALALAWPGGRVVTCEAAVVGHLVWPPRGCLGHGFDPMFVPEGATRSFAEMREAEKDGLSHRGRAVRRLLARCFT